MWFFTHKSVLPPFVARLTPSQNLWIHRKSGGEVDLRRDPAVWVSVKWYDGLVPAYVYDGRLFVGVNDPTDPSMVEFVKNVEELTEEQVVEELLRLTDGSELDENELYARGFEARPHRTESELEV